ncbi:hypothetical protein PYK79_46885, partial [Streptomyces sp. ID05-04B]|uniref:protein kinase domain-containing protein n=1 Tax=Streptomyces sp. ID05-04B TaxID=3028661 RepID=UPI0029C361B6|nr:hypothetical protein [Streptomyces sp. ID05-04B]
MAGAFGYGFVVPNGTGPCCQYVFAPSAVWTGRQIFPVFPRSKVASIAKDLDAPAARRSMGQEKPLLDPSGRSFAAPGGRRIVLTDFGIAAIQDTKALTMVGMLVGSPDYMAPERIPGRPQGPPSDVWSLGATLCAALAGHSPFARDTTLATLHAALYEEPELPADAGPLRNVLAALLEKDP